MSGALRQSRLKVLLEASHPAHIHFFIPIAAELISKGHSVLLAVRDKDQTRELARGTGLPLAAPPFERTRPNSRRVRIDRQAVELLRRVFWLRRIISRQRFDAVLTRNPSGVLAAALSHRPSIFDTDDGTEAGLHFRLGAAFATAITTPESLPEELGVKQHRYKGIKTTVFLHPDRFALDGGVLARYGINPGDRIAVARFSANTASHDIGVRSVPSDVIAQVIETVIERGHLILSIEGQGTRLMRARSETGKSPVGSAATATASVSASDFLHLLAYSQVNVGDSRSVTMEAVALGVPSLRISDTRHQIIDRVGEAYGLVEHFNLDEAPRFLAGLAEAMESGQGRDRNSRGYAQLLADSADVVPWFADLIERVVAKHTSRRRTRQ